VVQAAGFTNRRTTAAPGRNSPAMVCRRAPPAKSPWRSLTQIPNRIYALIETGDGVPVNGKETDRGKLWRSDDGGDNWRLVSYDRTLGAARTTTSASLHRLTMKRNLFPDLGLQHLARWR